MVEVSPVADGGHSVANGIFSNMPSLSSIVIVCLIVCIGIVIYYFWKKSQDDQHAKEEPLYYDYVVTVQDCIDNEKSSNLRLTGSSYNWKFLLFPPLFFLGFIPAFKVDKSVPVRDLNNNLIGRYRGHCERNDGTFNLLVSSGYKLFLFEQYKLIKFLRGMYDDETGQYHDFTSLIHFYPSLDNCVFIKLDSYGVETYKYFVVPHFTDGNGATINLRSALARVFNQVTNDINIIDVMKQGSAQLNLAFKNNAGLGIKQREPQKVNSIPEESNV